MTISSFDTLPTPSPAYVPSPTAEQFIRATTEGPVTERRMLILMGPRGTGKTTAAIFACLALAERLVREGRLDALPIRVACIRDTWTSLRRTTLVSFEENRLKGLPVEFRNGGTEAIIEYDRPLVHFWFFGLDHPGDESRLQGFSCGALWIEEPAPAAEMTGGVPAESLGVGATSLRQPGVPPRILVTLNPPHSDHWIIKAEDYLADLGADDVRIARFEMAADEKTELFETLAQEGGGAEAGAWAEAAEADRAYREANRAFLESIGRGDLVQRLVEGRVGDVQVGEAVVAPFSRKLHVTNGPLDIFRGLPVFRFWDAGGSPSCVFAQKVPGGLNILGSHTMVNTNMEAFIRDWVMPFMRKYGLTAPTGGTNNSRGRGPRAGFQFRDIGDPSMLHEGKTVRADYTTGRVVMEMLRTSFEPGPVDWSARREALFAAFSRKTAGDRMFIQIDPTENDLLIAALAGRFHYPRDQASGRITQTIEAAKRASGVHAQAVDALAYGLAVLYPAAEWLRQHQRRPVPSARPFSSSWLGA